MSEIKELIDTNRLMEVLRDDGVHHPIHYMNGGVECIDVIKSALTSEGFLEFLKGQAIKYLFRYDKKDNAVQDLQKAIWYIDKLIKEIS